MFCIKLRALQRRISISPGMLIPDKVNEIKDNRVLKKTARMVCMLQGVYTSWLSNGMSEGCAEKIK